MLKKQNSKILLGAALALAVSSSTFAFESVTEYQYDSRGRLIEVKDNANKSLSYSYDEAGNRVKVNDAPTSPVLDPKITSFIAPSTVSQAGTIATLTWASQDASYCSIAIFGDSSQYPNMPTSGSVGIQINENTGVNLKCHQGAIFDSSHKFIRIVSSGGGGRPN